MTTKGLKRKKQLTFMLMLLALTYWTFLRAPQLGRDDYGFRAEKIDLKLSQKFPPAMAFQIIDNEDLRSEPSIDETVIELKVGPPEIEPIQLEELTFGYLEPKPPGLMVNKPSVPSPVVVDNNLFTEEELLRLSVAQQQRGLQVEDLTPVEEEDSFGARFKAALREERSKNELQAKQESEPSVTKNTSDVDDVAKSTPARLVGLQLEGEIEFVKDGSLALTDKHFIDVRRFEEGVAKEVARVDLERGTFSMTVNNTRGVIVGRLTNQRGGVEGEGLLSVSDLVLAKKGTKLILKKTAQRLPVRVSSAYGKSERALTKVNVASAWNDPDSIGTDYEINSFDPQSEMIIEGKAQNHRDSIAMVDMSAGTELLVLPERMIWGLRDILHENEITLDLDRGDSLIYGLVQRNGRPLDGATVISSLGPTSYYGGFYLPDRTQQQTSDNGMFSIVSNQPGWQDLFIGLPDGKGFHYNVPIYPGKVMNIVAEAPSETIPVTLRSFDAFSGQPVRVKMEIQQLNDFVELGDDGVAVVELPKTKNLSFINVMPEAGYERTHFSYHHLLDYLHLPLIPKEWLEELKSSLKINDEMETGTIVGFVQGDDFLVEIPNKGSKLKIVYFDPTGRIVERGVNGGGFVVFNLEYDTPNLVIYSRRNRRALGRIVKADHDSIEVIQASFE